MNQWRDSQSTRDAWQKTWGEERDTQASKDFGRARQIGVRAGSVLLAAGLGAAIAVNLLRAVPALPTFPGIVFPSAAPGSTFTAAPSFTALPVTEPGRLAGAIAPAIGEVAHWRESGGSISAFACGVSGSGALLAGGYVLTAAHVINEDYTSDTPAGCNFRDVVVMFVNNIEKAPDFWYKAEIVAKDVNRDVAVLRITDPIDSAPPIASLPALTVYNQGSAAPVGSQLVFLGYPGIGGNTLSLSVGIVSGYDQLADGVRTIKTDAVLAGGSSGGPGVDGDGRIVGIVLQAGTPSAQSIADCRQYDSNGDGQITAADNCRQVGGQFVTILDSREIVTFLTEKNLAALISGNR